jgi:DNA-binding LacI/PurR family transcriptional regulator
VEAAAQKLGYYPHAMARSMLLERSHTVGLIISQHAARFYPELLPEFARGFAERGVRLLLFLVEREGDVSDILADIWRYRVDGVVCAAQLSSEDMQAFVEREIPLVLFNRERADAPGDAVLCDHRECGRLLVDEMWRAGCRRFALIEGPQDSAVSQARAQGVLDHLAVLGAKKPLSAPGDFSHGAGSSAFQSLWETAGGKLDAVIAVNDQMALGAMDAARAHLGLRIPEDVAVGGFDGITAAGWDSYRLCTVRQPVQRMTRAAVSLLMERIDNPEASPERRVFSGTLLPGESVAAERAAAR